MVKVFQHCRDGKLRCRLRMSLSFDGCGELLKPFIIRALRSPSSTDYCPELQSAKSQSCTGEPGFQQPPLTQGVLLQSTSAMTPRLERARHLLSSFPRSSSSVSLAVSNEARREAAAFSSFELDGASFMCVFTSRVIGAPRHALAVLRPFLSTAERKCPASDWKNPRPSRAPISVSNRLGEAT